MTTPAQWGPVVWRFLHMTAQRIGIKREQIHQIISIRLKKDLLDELNIKVLLFQKVLLDLAWVLPCKQCRDHFKYFMSREETITTDNVRPYIVDLHNRVSKQLGKEVYDFNLPATKTLLAEMYKNNNYTEHACLVLYCVLHGYDHDMYGRYVAFVENMKQLLYHMEDFELSHFLQEYVFVQPDKTKMLDALRRAYCRYLTLKGIKCMTDIELEAKFQIK
jgi:hypothetical protein